MTDCKIVIKAANQKYEDFNVDIPVADWTIKQLKQHLTENYPSNPVCESIRLIYSGKLLHDHWTLKECLRQNLQTSHIIHIVLPAPSSSNNAAKAGSPAPRASADDHYQPSLDDELTPGSSSNSDASTSSSDSPTPVQGSPTASEFVNNPINTFNELQNNLNNLIQQQQRRQQQQQYQQMSSKEQYNMIHANLLRYYESMGVSVQSNAWYSAYIQHLALYNYMHSSYLQSIGIIGPNPPTAATASVTTTTQETQNDRHAEENQQAPPAQPAARPAPPLVNQAALGGVAQDMGDREDDWLGILHNICSFLILFSIIYYYSSFERFVLIFSIVFILILYHKGWLTLQRRPAANANRRNAPNPNRPAQDPADPGQQPANNETEPVATDAAAPPGPVNPGTLRLILTFVFTFFTSLVPERPQGAVN